MKRPTRRQILGSTLLAMCGCASFARIPDSPARYLSEEDLGQEDPCDRTFVTVFASQNDQRWPCATHTFATALKATCVEGSLTVTEYHTISWLPRSLQIQVFSLRSEPGVNLPLVQTIEWAIREGHRISQWGPYECTAALYKRFVVHKQYLDSGAVGYQVLDTIGEAARLGNAAVCIHAVTDMDPAFSRTLCPLLLVGEASGRHITRELHQHSALIQPETTYPCLNEQLGITAYPIQQHRSPV